MKGRLEAVLEPRMAATAETLGWSISRQVRFGRYVLDFLVSPTPTVSLCVELDGAEWHADRALEDRRRDRWILSNFGIPTIRFLGVEVLKKPDVVVTEIVQCAARFARCPAVAR